MKKPLYAWQIETQKNNQKNDVCIQSPEDKTKKFIREHFYSEKLILEDLNENTDQDILIELLKPKYNFKYRFKAIQYIVDSDVNQKIFMDLAKNDEDLKICIEAIKKINPESDNMQYFLYELSINNNGESIQYYAVEKIWDEDMLISLGKKFPNRSFCKFIVDRISNQEVLTKIIINNPDLYICFNAIKEVNDKQLLNIIAYKCKFYYIRALAIENIWDFNVLEDIGKNDKHDYVRICALEKLYNINNPYSNLIDDVDYLIKNNFFAKEYKWYDPYKNIRGYEKNTPLNIKDMVLIHIIEKEFDLEFQGIENNFIQYENSDYTPKKKYSILFSGTRLDSESFFTSNLEKKIKKYCPIGFEYEIDVSLYSFEEKEQERLDLMYGRY